MTLLPDARIFVAEHCSFVGQALIRRLQKLGYHNIITRTRDELDLREKESVNAFFEAELPDYVFVSWMPAGSSLASAAAPAQWLRDTLLVMTNTIHAAYLYDVEKLVCMDCSATYADLGALPPSVSYLQAELIEESQRVCTVASNTTAELCDSYRKQYGCDFVSAVFSTLYGPGANADLNRTNPVLTLLRDMLWAREVGAPVLQWPGSDRWKRDLLYIEDMADACVFLASQTSESGPVHVGYGKTTTLYDLADAIKAAVGFRGLFEVDPCGPRLPARGAFLQDMLGARGWRPATELRMGIDQTYRWYLHNRSL